MVEAFLYDCGVGAALWGLRLLSPWVPKVKKGFSGRRDLVDRLEAFAKQHPAPFWFHVASSGELEQAIPVMDELRRQDPGVAILVTYFSPSGEKAAQLETVRRATLALALPWDHADYSPWELKTSLCPIFQKLQPRLLVLVHRELWPNLMRTAEKYLVPAVLISTYWPTPLFGTGLARRLSSLDWVGTVDAASAQKLKILLGESAPIEAVGDPRAERVLARKHWNGLKPRPERTVATSGIEPELPILLLASLHRQDVAALKDLPAQMKGIAVRWVIVPHDPCPKFAQELQDWLLPIGKATLWSEEGDVAGNGAIIVDKVGFLAELYERAAIVVIGGSFFYRVHNVWEPAAYFKPILTGRFIQNSAEALALSQKELLKVCHTTKEIAAEALRLLKFPSHYKQIAQGLEDFVNAQATVSRTYAKKLLQLARK